MFHTTNKIINNRQTHDFLGALVLGDQGSGKTIYSLNVARQIAFYDGLATTDDETWEWALEQVVHTLKELANALKGYDFENRRKILIFDDAGETAGVYNYAGGLKQIKELKNVLDLIRTSCECLLITAPVKEGLLKFIRDYNYWNIYITREKRYTRKATIKKARVGKAGHRKYLRYRYDDFNCFMPHKYYKKYSPYRGTMTVTALNKLLESQDRMDKRQKLEDMKLEKELKEFESNGR